MRCPKCDYVSFEEQGRCRNCGYDLSLADVSLRPPAKTNGGQADDLPLTLDPPRRDPARPSAGGSSRTPSAQGFDLPLFDEEGGAEESPPVPLPGARPPLAVRRGMGEGVKGRPQPSGVGDLQLDREPADLNLPSTIPIEIDAAPLREPEEETIAAEEPAAPAPVEAVEAASTLPLASIPQRLVGGVVDIVILGTIDVLVAYFTLRVLGLRFGDFWRLPLAPFTAFLVLLATGYLTMFTVLSGQTMGKMVAGIQVVSADLKPVRLGPAIIRAIVQIVTIPLLGVGFLPALISPERRALHDRLADTIVVVQNR